MFDTALLGHSPQTAIALMALHTSDSVLSEDRDIETMRNDMMKDGSPLALGLGCLALRILGIDSTDAFDRLTSLQKENGSWSNNCYHTALVLLAERGTL